MVSGWVYSSTVSVEYAFIVALCVPWCRQLEGSPLVAPQLYADNRKCSSVCPLALFDVVRFIVRYVRAFGPDVSPGKCVLLSTSKTVRKSMMSRDVSGDGVGLLSWMSGILAVIWILLEGLGRVLFSSRVREAPTASRLCLRCRLGLGPKLGSVWSKFLPERRGCSRCCSMFLPLSQVFSCGYCQGGLVH